LRAEVNLKIIEIKVKVILKGQFSKKLKVGLNEIKICMKQRDKILPMP